MDSDDQTITLYSMFATLATGVDSVPYLLKGMTNRCAEVRSEAVTTLTWGSGFANERRKALPLLSHLLNDPDEMVRQTATNALKEINLPNATRTKIK